MNYFKEALKIHQKNKGKLAIISKVPLANKKDLSLAYTPGVAQPCLEIAKKPDQVYKYTIKGNSVAVVTNGTAVLGLGNIGPKAALPVMEGKCLLFKKFADIDAYPLCLETEDPEEIIKTVKLIAPGFGGINLEDIKAPDCFYIEERLKAELDIPVFHDDQHGTAIVVLAGLINSLKIYPQKKSKLRIVINGCGAAGVAIAKILNQWGVGHIIMLDSQGIVSKSRKDLNSSKKAISQLTNKENRQGGLTEALKGADVFIGVSVADILKPAMIKLMNQNPFIFAMANPNPEIKPAQAKKAGAAIVATGRSDFPNQVNNVLAFPGIFRGVLDGRASQITEQMKIKAAEAIAAVVKKPTVDKIIPSVFDKQVVKKVTQAVKKCIN